MGDLDGNRNFDNEEVKEAGKFPLKKLLKVFLIFKIRVPLWSVAIVAVLILGFWGYGEVTTDDPVNLRPIVQDSRLVDVTVTMCNERVDELGLDIRKEELRLQERFEKIENAQEARVNIKRELKQENCKELGNNN